MSFDSRKSPQRVFALRSMDETTAYSYGVGTYVGDLVPPWMSEEPDEGTRQIILDVLKGEDEREEPFAIGMIEFGIEQGHMTPEEGEAAKERAYAHQKAEAARPIEERIAESYALMNKNPCIQLDSGDTIWGAQCWWGPEERMDEKVQGRKVEIVPVPEHNERWKP